MVIALCVTGLAIATIAGWGLPRSIWDATQAIRFTGDIRNNYRQGQRADAQGILLIYDKVAADAPVRPDGNSEYGLDYPPLRLTVAWLWYRWSAARFPQAHDWENSWEFNAPLLVMNRAMLLIGAIGAFASVLLIRRRCAAPAVGTLPIRTGVFVATIAAILTWFSLPANLISFGWPQWDTIVPAAFLASLALALADRWLLAGAVLATATMFKGQTLVALPILVLWPLVAGMWLALVRFVAGFALAAGVIAAPFMLHTASGSPDWSPAWLCAAILLTWLVGLISRGRNWRAAQWLLPGGASFAIVSLCAFALGGAKLLPLTIFLAAVAMAAGARLPSRQQGLATALLIAGAVWACAIVDRASFAWLRAGLLYGSYHYPQMIMGGASNFPAILAYRFSVLNPNAPAFVLPSWLGSSEVSWRDLLRTVFAAVTVLCGVAAGVRYRRRDPAFAIAAVAPILVFVAFMPQMHERYVSYAAVTSVVFLAAGYRWLLVHISLSILATFPVLQGMLGPTANQFMVGSTSGEQLRTYVLATFPGIGWALIALTIVCVGSALVWRCRPAEGHLIERQAAGDDEPADDQSRPVNPVPLAEDQN